MNTETGVYASVAAVVALFVLGPGFVLPAFSAAALAVSTAIFLIVWNWVAFGAGIFQWQYLMMLLEPLLLYSAGLGAWSIEWLGGYHWIYNFILPGLALATIGWAVGAMRAGRPGGGWC